MGMSTYCKAFVSSDDPTYRKHCEVLRACIDAGIKELPKETAEYFGEKYPEEYLFEQALEIDIPIHDYEADMEEGIEILVSEIPKGTYKIRFYNSY